MKRDQLSQTAAFIAIKFYGLTRIDACRSLFDNSTVRFYEKIVRFLPAPLSYYHYWLKFKWIRSFYIRSEEILLPGDLMHVLARKWYIPKIVDELLEKKYEQLIVLGAGFDHLGCQYSRKEIHCFEIDTPHMARLKQQFLDETYPSERIPAINEGHFPGDSLKYILRRHPNIDPRKKTIVIAEGFFDYLDSKTVESTIKNIPDYFKNETALICTHFSLDELSEFHRRVFQSGVSIVGEKLQFYTRISEFKTMLSNHGWDIDRIYTAGQMQDELSAAVDKPWPVLKGFYILAGFTNANKHTHFIEN